MARPSIYEDGTNVARGTKFIAVDDTKYLPWYNPAEGKAPANWLEKWAKLRERLEKIIDDYCKVECVLIQRRIPASAPVEPQYPVFLQGRQFFHSCNGMRIEPSRLLVTEGKLSGLFAFNDVRGEPMLDHGGRPVAFRLGMDHQFIVCPEIGWDEKRESLPLPKLIDLARDGTNLLFQLPPEIACSLWRNFPAGFSRSKNSSESLWLDALFQLALQQPPGNPLFTKRYYWEQNGSIQVEGDGLFPRKHDFSVIPDAARTSHKDDYPMAYYARQPDLARASVAAIDEIIQRENKSPVASKKRFKIGLSFPGENRAYVERIADNLAVKFGRACVLYDKFHEAEFAQPNLDVYLPKLYVSECDLIAVFVCAQYANKRWCKLEFRSIRQLIETTESNRIMLLSFDNIGAIDQLGITGGDGYVPIGKRPPDEITRLILDRFNLLTRQNATEKQTH